MLTDSRQQNGVQLSLFHNFRVSRGFWDVRLNRPRFNTLSLEAHRNVRGATGTVHHQGEAWRTSLQWPPAKRPLADGASSIPTALTGATATSSSYHTLGLTAVRWLAGVRVRRRPNHGAAPKAAAK
jgi:hypothetical protein